MIETDKETFWEELYYRLKNIKLNYYEDISYFEISDFEDYDSWISPIWGDPNIFNLIENN